MNGIAAYSRKKATAITARFVAVPTTESPAPATASATTRVVSCFLVIVTNPRRRLVNTTPVALTDWMPPSVRALVVVRIIGPNSVCRTPTQRVTSEMIQTTPRTGRSSTTARHPSRRSCGRERRSDRPGLSCPDLVTKSTATIAITKVAASITKTVRMVVTLMSKPATAGETRCCADDAN
jgi:hypothetical protein